jgi:hypothetical protein
LTYTVRVTDADRMTVPSRGRAERTVFVPGRCASVIARQRVVGTATHKACAADARKAEPDGAAAEAAADVRCRTDAPQRAR